MPFNSPETLIFDKSYIMTTKQLKQEVVTALYQMPDEVLSELLAYLQSLQGKDVATIQRAQHLKRILAEDSALLKSLAQ